LNLFSIPESYNISPAFRQKQTDKEADKHRNRQIKRLTNKAELNFITV
jgi:hypothetical protein